MRFSVLFLLGRKATLVVMIAGWNVHDGSGFSGLGNLRDSLIKIKKCQLYACTRALRQVQDMKHECSRSQSEVCYNRGTQDSSQRDQTDTCKFWQFAQSREPLYTRVKHSK